MNHRSLLVSILITCLFLVGLISRNGTVTLMVIPLLIYLGVGLLSLPKDSKIFINREISINRIKADAPVVMKIRIKNQSSSALILKVIDKIPLKVTIIDGSINQFLNLSANEEFEMQYTFQAPRGHYIWGKIDIIVSDPFRLFEKKLNLSSPEHIHVLPEYAKIKKINLRPRSTIHTPGPNLSDQPGSGIDFWGIREYLPGDSLRLIDWRKTARYTKHFFVKEYEREEMIDIGLLLDARLKTNPPYDNNNIIEHSIQATAALAKHFIKSGNRVSMLVLSTRLTRVFPGYGKQQLTRILDQLSNCKIGEKVSVDVLKYLPTKLFPSHSVIILISPLCGEDLNSIKQLKSDGYQIMVLSPDYIQLIGKNRLSDKTHEYALRAAKIERTLLLWNIRQLGVETKNWDVDKPIDININLRRNFRNWRPG